MRVRPGRVEEIAARLRAAGCVFAEEEAALLLEATSGDALEALIARRVAGEPLELVVGWAELAGVRVRVAPGVFVPRRRSELLVREAAALLRPGCVVVDLCCGTGAVAAALLAKRAGTFAPQRYAIEGAPGDPEVHAADIDPAAVACARENLGDRAAVHEGDLFAALPDSLRGRIDLLAANAPYVPTAEIPLMPREARDHEPHTTLDGGGDGVEIHRRIAAEAPAWLAPGGSLLIETSEHQAPLTAEAMDRAGLATETARDENLDATIVLGSSPRASRGDAWQGRRKRRLWT